MTRTQIKSTSRYKLGETTAVFWTEAILNQWCEDAQLDLVWKAKTKRTRANFTPTASTVRYTLTTLVTNILRIVSGGVKIYNKATVKWEQALTQRTKEWLNVKYPSWENADTGTPMLYTVDYELDELVIYPACDADHVGTDYGEITHSSKPTAMSADASSPDLPTVLHPAVIDYVVATGLESRGYQDIASVHWQAYQVKINDYLAERRTEEDAEIIMRPSRE